MKEYKAVLVGKNNTTIDDIFNHMQEGYKIVCSSLRYDDMNNHLDLVEPDIFIVCLNGETRDDISKLAELKRKLTRMETSVFIIGSKEDCENFQKGAVYMADEVFEKPISIDEIKKGIAVFQAEKERKKLEDEELQRQLEALKEQDRRKHVLVIDDDPIMLRLIKEHLHENYDVATAISGKIAYKFLESKKTDLILLDYEMPVEDGPAVLSKLREGDTLNGVPVLFLTGVTDKEKIKTALMLQPQGYLLKPIDKDKLIGTIEKFIG